MLENWAGVRRRHAYQNKLTYQDQGVVKCGSAPVRTLRRVAQLSATRIGLGERPFDQDSSRCEVKAIGKRPCLDSRSASLGKQNLGRAINYVTTSWKFRFPGVIYGELTLLLVIICFFTHTHTEAWFK